MTSLPSRFGAGARPAPDVPEAATMTMSLGSAEPAGQQRGQGQDRGGGVAAGRGHLRRGADLLPRAGELGQAVGPVTRVLAAVELGPGRGIGEPEPGAQVDDLGVRRKLGGQRGGLRVRQRHEHEVGPAQHGGIGRPERAVREPDEVRVHGRDRNAGVRPGGQRPDLQIRVIGQEPEQLTPGVAAGACDSDPCAHGVLSSCVDLRRARAVHRSRRNAAPYSEKLCSPPKTYATRFA